jgi:hypothetical protein
MNFKLYSKEELLIMATPYLEKNDIMYATTDGQFFYAHAKGFADGHASSLKGVMVYQLAAQELANLLKDSNKDGVISKEEELAFAEKAVEKAQDKFDNTKRADYKVKAKAELDEAQRRLDELKQK